MVLDIESRPMEVTRLQGNSERMTVDGLRSKKMRHEGQHVRRNIMDISDGWWLTKWIK
jgi:hypothetical protein